MDYQELLEMVKKGLLKEHHKSLHQGYVSRKKDGVILPYNGRFGEGYMLFSPNFDSSRFCFVTYYIFNNKEEK